MINVSAPGSLMVCGEHAVVYGHAAMVCAIAQRITIRLVPRADNRVLIHSALAEYEVELDKLIAHPQLTFVIEVLRQNPLSVGAEIWIDSDIDSTLGFGSSAAVTVALIAAIWTFQQKTIENLMLHQAAHRVILAVQQRGSGTDIAASIFGGLLAYYPYPEVSIVSLPIPPTLLSVRYAGYKTPTREVLASIAEKMAQNPDYYQQLYAQMGQTTAQGISAAQAENWSDFYQRLNGYQVYLQRLGVCDTTQAAHLHELAGKASAAKISGSGLGDCIIAFSHDVPPRHYTVNIDRQGLLIHTT